MNVPLLKIPFVATWLLALSPLVGSAQNISSRMALTPRHLERLTLLPGPYFLSPARGAPVVTAANGSVPELLKTGGSPSFRFIPAYEHFMRGGSGTRRLLDSERVNPLSLSGRISDPSRNARRAPPAETLRFESTLRPIPLPLKSQ